ncbi:MFS transporter [Streptomyces genisteinicus]|uniref:MFS transporter n=1 Tax=Streptomyces genisteinicus TaxID=2768068 RepID=A0A7H0I3B9_9ACTN|nr:MFS transporter [Streptomyces genisteinicus]
MLRWLGAYGLSATGDSVYHVALTWAATRGGSAAEAGAVLAAGAVPRALLMLGGGVLADRIGPRTVVLVSDTARCLVVLGLAALLWLTTPGLWVLAAVAVVFGILDAVFMPAVGALPPRIVPRGQLARVQGLRGLAGRGATVAGAPLGGAATALSGAPAAFTAAAALFALSLPLLLTLRIAPLPPSAAENSPPGPVGSPAAERGGRLKRLAGDLADGLRYVRGHRVLGPLIVVVAVSDLGFVGPLGVGLALLAEARGWGAPGLGWLLAGFAAGSAAASLLLAVRGRIPRAGLVMGLALVTGSAAIAALALLPGLVAAVAVAALVGVLTGVSGSLCGALLQTAADPAHLGRVTSLATFVSLGLAPLSFPLTGAAVGLWDATPVFAVSALVCAAGAVYGLCSVHLRRAELPH